jgi:hypothetical protein
VLNTPGCSVANKNVINCLQVLLYTTVAADKQAKAAADTAAAGKRAKAAADKEAKVGCCKLRLF